MFGIDLYLHRKHGMNLWGYRGPAAGPKLPGEKRVAILGGSTTWGFGLSYGQDFPAQLQTQLANQTNPPPPIRIINLGFNNEGAYSFNYTLKDYAYLDYDAVVLYSGYNDLTFKNRLVFRHRSPIFRWTGYMPLLPALTADKISVWLNQHPVVFTPNRNDGAGAAAELNKLMGRLPNDPPQPPKPAAQCPPEFQDYCEQIYAATNLALQKGKSVLVVGEPYINNKHVAQQNALEGMLLARFAGQPKVRYLNLGRTVDLRDPSLCWDGMHLTAEGNRRVAAALQQPLRDFLQQ